MEERLKELRLREDAVIETRHNPSSEAGKKIDLKEEPVITQEEFNAIEVLKREGLKKKKVARILGLDPKTVRRYWKMRKQVRQEQRKKVTKLAAWQDHLQRRAPETDYCARVCFLEIQKLGYEGGYEQVKRFIRPLREDRRRVEEATLRFETGPGKQAQVDWGSIGIVLGGKRIRIHLFVMVLCYSRRMYVRAELNETLQALIRSHEMAYEWFGGLTETALYDNPKTVCLKRDFEGKDITWNPGFLDFCRYRGFEPRLCKPYRARTKGKVESGIKYVKRSFFGLYGRVFNSLDELNEKLGQWILEVADERIHGTTHEKPSDRFQGERLLSLGGKAPYRIEMDTTRIIPSDALVVYKTNRYSVPWRTVGKEAVLEESGERLKIYVEGNLAVDHPLLGGRHQQNIIPGHYEGILRPQIKPREASMVRVSLWPNHTEEVQERDLASYETFAAGGVS